jgi:Rrf2 family transcriptional regulator, iron-sulfur cluster assembly transcription factor
MHTFLPVSVQYAMRAVVVLAAREPGAWVPARDLVETTHVPAAYLPKVLRRLVEHGILEAVKGHHGGFRLAKAPRAINLFDVITAFDDESGQQPCHFGYETCSPSDPCPLHPFVTELNERVRGWARSHTFAEVDGADFLSKPPARAVLPPRVGGDRPRRA